MITQHPSTKAAAAQPAREPESKSVHFPRVLEGLVIVRIWTSGVAEIGYMNMYVYDEFINSLKSAGKLRAKREARACS